MHLHRSQTSTPRRLLTMLFATLLLCGGFVATQAPATADAAGVTLLAGDVEYSSIWNCTSIALGYPMAEAGLGAYVGGYADPTVGAPAVNQTFYVEVYIAGLGDACGGQHVSVELALPAGVSLSITPSTPIECYIGNQTLIASQCAQSMQASPFRSGALWYPSPDAGAGNTWPLAQGGTWRFKFPVKSTTALNAATLQAYLMVVDGWSNPVLTPRSNLYVFSSAAPTVLYPSPSTVFTPVPNSVNFTTKSTTTVFKPVAQSGTVTFDLSNTANFTTILNTQSSNIPSGSAALSVFTDWAPFVLQPNTKFYWRARYQPTGGSQVIGATQSFTTPAAGKKVVGNGTAASCTTAAIDAAFTPTTERVDFDCGPLPVTIQLSDGYYTEANDGPLTIDGKGKVTLVAASGMPIFIHNGGNLNLIGLTLKGGNWAGCGGAVQIGSGTASLVNMRIVGNRATSGGGLCTMDGTTVDIWDSVISGNAAYDGSGGGIYAGGNVYMNRSEVRDNTAYPNGGGGVAAAGDSFEADNSTFAGNQATGSLYGRGGGLLFESGTTGDIATSTISGNSALKGGGVHNEGDSWLLSVTVAYNTSTEASRGGGIESQTTGFDANLRLRNSIVSNNTNTSSGSAVSANCASNASYRQHTSLGTNLVSDSTCNFNEVGDLQNTDPQLRPLQLNGGTTRTHALPITSPAVDSANNPYCGMFDQRGANDGSTTDAVSRNLDSDGNGSKICDRGAYELVPGPVFVPLTPARLMETRPANGTTDPVTKISSNTNVTVDGQAQNLGLRAAGTTTVLKVTDRAGVPGDALAVSLNVTAVGSTAGGGLTVFPCGTAMPFATTLTYDTGAIVANAAVVPVGPNGTICVYNSSATNVIVDVNGYMPAASRYQGIAGRRYVDTRQKGITFDGIGQKGGAVAAGTFKSFQISGRGTTPAGTASVMLEVTIPAPAADGYVTVYPCGTMPPTSSVNVKAGVTTSNAVFTGLSNTGTICVFTSSTMDVVVDLVGSLPSGTTLTPLAPQRLLDSRPSQVQPADDGVNTVRPAGSVTEVVVANRGGVSATATTAVLNITAVNPAGKGYLTVYPCDAARPNSSNLNYVTAVNRANLVIVKVPTTGPKAGRVCIFTSQQTHLIADVMGQVT